MPNNDNIFEDWGWTPQPTGSSIPLDLGWAPLGQSRACMRARSLSRESYASDALQMWIWDGPYRTPLEANDSTGACLQPQPSGLRHKRRFAIMRNAG